MAQPLTPTKDSTASLDSCCDGMIVRTPRMYLGPPANLARAQEHVVKPNNWPPQNPCTFPNLILYDDDNLYVYEPCMNNLYICKI